MLNRLPPVPSIIQETAFGMWIVSTAKPDVASAMLEAPFGMPDATIGTLDVPFGKPNAPFGKLDAATGMPNAPSLMPETAS